MYPGWRVHEYSGNEVGWGRAGTRPRPPETQEAGVHPVRPSGENLGSGAAAPEPAVAPEDEREVLFVARPALVLRKLDFLLGRVPALAGLSGFLHRGRGVLQEREQILGILLRAQSTAWAGMAGNELVPIHRQDFLHRVFPLQRIGVDHAPARYGADRDEVDR